MLLQSGILDHKKTMRTCLHLREIYELKWHLHVLLVHNCYIQCEGSNTSEHIQTLCLPVQCHSLNDPLPPPNPQISSLLLRLDLRFLTESQILILENH